jgi:alpha-D-ribose 1-methylphosphonate 5-triphosphate synthase subunit PhnH
VFRQVLHTMSRPGTIVTVNGDLENTGAFSPAMAALALTLLDFETLVWADLPSGDSALGWLQFHCGCPFTADPGEAAFVLVTDPERLPDLAALNPGSEQFPESGATLIIETAGLEACAGKLLKGPGIQASQELSAQGLPERFWRQRQTLGGDFPLGVDVIFTADRKLCALPRTTQIETTPCT